MTQGLFMPNYLPQSDKLATTTHFSTNSAGTSSNHDWGTCQLGPAFSGRKIIAFATGSSGTGGRSFTSMTANSIVGTRVANYNTGSGGNQTVACFTFEGLTGTEAVFTGTSTANVGNGTIIVMALTGVESLIPVATDAIGASNAPSHSINLPVDRHSVAVACLRKGSGTSEENVVAGAEVIADGNVTFGLAAQNMQPPGRTITVSYGGVNRDAKFVGCAFA